MPNCRFKVAADLSVAHPQAAEAHDACGVWWMRVAVILEDTNCRVLNSGHPRGGLLRFACKAARSAPFQPFTGWLKSPAATGCEPDKRDGSFCQVLRCIFILARATSPCGDPRRRPFLGAAATASACFPPRHEAENATTWPFLHASCAAGLLLVAPPPFGGGLLLA